MEWGAGHRERQKGKKSDTLLFCSFFFLSVKINYHIFKRKKCLRLPATEELKEAINTVPNLTQCSCRAKKRIFPSISINIELCVFCHLVAVVRH